MVLSGKAKGAAEFLVQYIFAVDLQFMKWRQTQKELYVTIGTRRPLKGPKIGPIIQNMMEDCVPCGKEIQNMQEANIQYKQSSSSRRYFVSLFANNYFISNYIDDTRGIVTSASVIDTNIWMVFFPSESQKVTSVCNLQDKV